MKNLANKSIKKTLYYHLIPFIFFFGIITAISIVWVARNLLFYIYEDTTKYYMQIIGNQIDSYENDLLKINKLINVQTKDTVQKHFLIVKIGSNILSNMNKNVDTYFNEGLKLLENNNLNIKITGIGPSVKLTAALITKRGNILILKENAKFIAHKYYIAFIIIFLIVVLNLTAMAFLISSTVFFPVINKLNKIKDYLQKYKSDKKIRIPGDKKPYEEFNLIYEEFNRMAFHIEEVDKKLIETKDNEITTLAGIAHDINTPITVLRGTAENLISYGSVNTENKKNVMKILDQAIYIQMLVDDMLTIAKADLSEIHVNYNEIDLDNLFDRMVNTFELIASDKKITLIADAHNIKLFADELRLTQILNNLIRNAIIHAKDANIIEIYAKEDEKNIIIKVSDNGCGINEFQIDKIFNKFYSTKSSGLGLYVVKLLMEKHKGNCIYKNDNGSEFTLIFPKKGKINE